MAKDLRATARAEGLSITDLVEVLLAEHRDRGVEARARKLAVVRQILAEVDALPRLGPPLTDDELYDADGLPR